MSEKQSVGYLLGAVAGLVLLVMVVWSAAAGPESYTHRATERTGLRGRATGASSA